VLYFRDIKMKEPAVFMNVSPDGQECALSLSVLPELRPLRIKNEFFLQKYHGQIDFDPKIRYEFNEE
jgi:hypothetical protein